MGNGYQEWAHRRHAAYGGERRAAPVFAFVQEQEHHDGDPLVRQE